MSLAANPIVEIKIAEFERAVERLCTGNWTDEVKIGVIRQLCDLSRNAKFGLGTPKYAGSTQACNVAALLKASVGRMRSSWTDKGQAVPADADKYLKNIEGRAQRCRDEY